MLVETLKLPKGHVKIYAISNGKKELIVDKHNALTSDALLILAARIANDVEYSPLNRISAYDAIGGALLATATVTRVIHPGSGGSTMIAVFSEASFAGTVKELKLQTDNLTNFSIVNGFSVTKTNLLQLAVEWTITFS